MHISSSPACAYCCRGSEFQRMAFKDKVDVACKLDALSAGESEEPVVIKDTVEGLDPLRINVSIADNPGMLLKRLFHNLQGNEADKFRAKRVLSGRVHGTAALPMKDRELRPEDSPGEMQQSGRRQTSHVYPCPCGQGVADDAWPWGS